MLNNGKNMSQKLEKKVHARGKIQTCHISSATMGQMGRTCPASPAHQNP